MRQVVVIAALGAAGVLLGARFLTGLAGLIFPDSGAEHGAWYASRAAGLTSYLLLWLAATVGVLMSSAWLDGLVNRGRLLAVHQWATYAGLLLATGHALVLIEDGWTTFALADLFVPFASYYEPVTTALGTLALYLFALVAFSFWLRGAIGTSLWRRIHLASFIALIGAFWHGISLGTDSKEPWGIVIYLTTSALLLTAVVMRLTYLKPKPVRKPRAASAPRPANATPSADRPGRPAPGTPPLEPAPGDASLAAGERGRRPAGRPSPEELRAQLVRMLAELPPEELGRLLEGRGGASA